LLCGVNRALEATAREPWTSGYNKNRALEATTREPWTSGYNKNRALEDTARGSRLDFIFPKNCGESFSPAKLVISHCTNSM